MKYAISHLVPTIEHSKSINNYDEIPDDNLLNHTSKQQLSIESIDIDTDNHFITNKSTWFASYINLTSTLIGSSVLGFPFAYSKAGWILGSILLIICGIFTTMGLHLQSICALRIGLPCSYYILADKCFPSQFSYIIDIAVLLKCYGAATSYFIIIGDLMPFAMSKLLPHIDVLSSRLFWILCIFIIVTPLCFNHDLHSLKWPSLISIVFLLSLTMIVILFSSNVSMFNPCIDYNAIDDCKGDTTNISMTYETIKCLSIFIFGFTCQHNTFSIVNELKDVNQLKLNSIFISSVSTAFIIYSTIAICGYSTYGSFIKADFLNSYPDTNIINVARICISIIAALHYPLQCNPGRRSFISIINKAVNELGYDNTAYHNYIFIITTCLFLGLSLITALSVSNLGIVFSLIGATGSTMVSLILPGLFYYTLHIHDEVIWRKYFALGQFTFGLLFMPIAVSIIFIYN